MIAEIEPELQKCFPKDIHLFRKPWNHVSLFAKRKQKESKRIATGKQQESKTKARGKQKEGNMTATGKQKDLGCDS